MRWVFPRLKLQPKASPLHAYAISVVDDSIPIWPGIPGAWVLHVKSRSLGCPFEAVSWKELTEVERVHSVNVNAEAWKFCPQWL